MGGGALVPSRIGGLGRVVRYPDMVRVDHWPKTYVVHSVASRKPLVAMNLLIFIARRHHDVRY